MDGKHTKGSWIATLDTDGECRSFISEASAPESWVGFARHNGREEANAALMAAAPDMFEALKDAREAILQLTNSRGSEAEGSEADWVAAIDAALARAQVQPIESAPDRTDTTTSWPARCSHPNSCSRHKQCMYVGCAYEGVSIRADIEAAISTETTS